MNWQVSMTDDEILLEYRRGFNHILISIDEDGPSYAIREEGSGFGFMPGRFDLKGGQFLLALDDIRKACAQT